MGCGKRDNTPVRGGTALVRPQRSLDLGLGLGLGEAGAAALVTKCAVHLAAMRNVNHQNGDARVVDRVDDAIVAHPHSPEVSVPGKRPRARWSRVSRWCIRDGVRPPGG